jgi:hypothetical protein
LRLHWTARKRHCGSGRGPLEGKPRACIDARSISQINVSYFRSCYKFCWINAYAVLLPGKPAVRISAVTAEKLILRGPVFVIAERNQALIGEDTGGHQWTKNRSASFYKNMGSFCCICRPNYLWWARSHLPKRRLEGTVTIAFLVHLQPQQSRVEALL